MLLRSPFTVIPVLGGLVAGDTAAVKSVLPPGSSELGLAETETDRAPPLPQKFDDELLRGSGPLTLKSRRL